MRISEIEAHLIELKDKALAAFDIPADVASQISLANPPDPTMGDRGFPVFLLARQLRKGPPQIAQQLVDALQPLVADDPLISEVSAAGPYVNLRLNPAQLANIVISEALDRAADFGSQVLDGQKIMIEFSAPNTNKPQHLGHVRNNLLGDSVARILDFAGHDITRVNLINDRGIHICKSMLAYQRFGQGETPESAAIKGDHLVGKYYVRFDQAFRQEYADWQHTEAAQARFEAWLNSPESKDARKAHGDDAQTLLPVFFSAFKDIYFNTLSELGGAARQMLRDWEAGEPQVVALWKTMNQWVFDGFDETYARLGVHFDRVYYESNTYKLGKSIVEEGLNAGNFKKLDDGAVVCDLEALGLQGQKVLLRGDGTSVYMTQDLGTALARFEEYDVERMIYVVGDEQNYHFDVLFRILSMLRPELEGNLNHLSYGMVELPDGKMKSREGRVVDADDLMDEMEALASTAVAERYADLSDDEQAHRARVIGLAALKYFILDFSPRSTVQFDPQKSIDFQGRTGPYCLYSYARISSIERRVGGWPNLSGQARDAALESLTSDLELAVIRQLQDWPRMVETAAAQLSPGRITEALFNLSKAFSTLYNDADHRIVDLEGPRKDGLLLLARAVQNALGAGLSLLGIETLNEM
ncbi:arginine--tRNA ligase [Lujinxingia litoralis]|uniref:Arginine--tRNA ligase n=1 Tax=Lujinxingia litoralis TaxID=2211119 RepID=A0A328C872_9DELT|nr:arginine--tRNA ligase [Lujinxingia litoralis]RAL24797.1 arginine--tRNA ligase [Lujinxingia litoralis]